MILSGLLQTVGWREVLGNRVTALCPLFSDIAGGGVCKGLLSLGWEDKPWSLLLPRGSKLAERSRAIFVLFRVSSFLLDFSSVAMLTSALCQ